MTSAIDLRCGDWREVLADVGEVDAVICDPPYSPRVHKGFRSGNDYDPTSGRTDGYSAGNGVRLGGLPYEPLTPEAACEVAARFAGASWQIYFGDHISQRWWADALDAIGWYVFAPVVWLRTGGGQGLRFQGDGPASDCEYITVGRPKRRTKCGSLPGSYVGPKANPGDQVVKGGKPAWLMRALVADYTLPGQIVVDPFSGGASTLIAAAELGCTAIGAELDPETYAKAQKRIARGYTPLPHPRANKGSKPTQGALW